MYRTGATPLEIGCPRCDTMLAVGRAGPITAHGCGSCGGVWLDNAGTQRLVTGLSPQVVAGFSAHAAAASSRVDTRENVACPVCRQPTLRKRIVEASVNIDICADHGTWFDRREIEAVHKSFHGAGQTDKTPDIRPEALDMRTGIHKGMDRIAAALDAVPESHVEVEIGDMKIRFGDVDPYD